MLPVCCCKLATNWIAAHSAHLDGLEGLEHNASDGIHLLCGARHDAQGPGACCDPACGERQAHKASGSLVANARPATEAAAMQRRLRAHDLACIQRVLSMRHAGPSFSQSHCPAAGSQSEAGCHCYNHRARGYVLGEQQSCTGSKGAWISAAPKHSPSSRDDAASAARGSAGGLGA